MRYQLKQIHCRPWTLNGLSLKLIESHYENNYGGAVKRLNAITEQVQTLDFSKAAVFTINGLKREELIATNSMILHELYFGGLGESAAPSGKLLDAIKKDFSSFERWQAEFSFMGKAQGGGSGLGIAQLLAPRQETRQSMGSRSHLQPGWRHADTCARHV